MFSKCRGRGIRSKEENIPSEESKTHNLHQSEKGTTFGAGGKMGGTSKSPFVLYYSMARKVDRREGQQGGGMKSKSLSGEPGHRVGLAKEKGRGKIHYNLKKKKV